MIPQQKVACQVREVS